LCNKRHNEIKDFTSHTATPEAVKSKAKLFFFSFGPAYKYISLPTDSLPLTHDNDPQSPLSERYKIQIPYFGIMGEMYD
jgi:hypothetical protein